MKKRNIIIVVTSMLCCVLSLLSLCFTIAWYVLYPSYTNISFGVGDYALILRNQVFLRTRAGAPAQGDASAPAEGTPTFNAAIPGTDYNIKTEVEPGGVDHSNINGTHDPNSIVDDKANGRITYKFPTLQFDVFGNITTADGTIYIPKGGLFDEETMSWNVDFLTFAILDLSFFNNFFNSYLSGTFQMNIDGSLAAGLDINNFFNIKKIVDNRLDIDITETQYSADGEAKDLRKSLLGTPIFDAMGKWKNVEVNAFNEEMRTKLCDYGTGPGTKDYLKITSGKKYDLFGDWTPPQDPNAPMTTTTLTIAPNPNKIADQLNYYASAMGLALSINPMGLYEYLTKNAVANASINIEFIIDFAKSNMPA